MKSRRFTSMAVAASQNSADGKGWALSGFGAISLSLLLACGAATTAVAPASGAEDADAVAISAKASSDYVRHRLADGSFRPETFAFGKGGVFRGTEGGAKDMLDFIDVANTLARPLANRGYLPGKDPTTTKLLVLVYWGTTRTPENSTNSIAGQNLEAANNAALAANHPQQAHFNPNDSMAPQQMAFTATAGYAIRSPEQVDLDNAVTGALAASAAEDEQRRLLDAQNASLLGYDASLADTAQTRGTALEYRQRDLIDELEYRRYFVVLMAYDFQLLRKERKHKLLWETRFSVREKNNDFSKQLAGMAECSSRYFGQNSGKPIHSTLPEGHVEIGPFKTLASDQRN